MTLTPQFRFGPIVGVQSMSYSLSRGIQPSVCTVRIPFDANIADKLSRGQLGRMVISDGKKTISLKDCVVSDIDMTIDGDGGQSMVIAILDRRWRWRYQQISGEYNVRQSETLDEGTVKTPQELATILLKAMGEKKFEVKQMPNKTYPYCNWDMMVPALALQELCSQLKCHVCYCADDIVRIYEDGIGNELPNVPSSSAGVGFDVGSRPGKIGAASGAFQWQFDFPLTPVGLDTKDGKIKPINELSYAPKEDKWKYVVPATMNGIEDVEFVKGQKGKPDKGTKQDERKVAKETVWRWYRIGLPKKLKKMPIANEKILSIRQFMPLLDHQLESIELTDVQELAVSIKGAAYEKEIRRKLPVQVWGLFYDEAGTGTDNVDDFDDKYYVSLNQTSTSATGQTKLVNQKLIYPKGFTIDNERMLVIFADPVYRIKDGYIPPTLYLRAACNFRHAETRAAYRWQIQRKVGGPDQSLVEWQSREDVIPEWRQSSTGDVYNGKDVEKSLNYYLDSTAKKYDSRIPGHIEVPSLLPFSPDGRIAQVTFDISGDGFISTSIHKEIEGWQTPVPYKERVTQANIALNQERLAQLYGKQKQ